MRNKNRFDLQNEDQGHGETIHNGTFRWKISTSVKVIGVKVICVKVICVKVICVKVMYVKVICVKVIYVKVICRIFAIAITVFE